MVGCRRVLGWGWRGLGGGSKGLRKKGEYSCGWGGDDDVCLFFEDLVIELMNVMGSCLDLLKYLELGQMTLHE